MTPDGSVVVITGATRGIGLATARLLHAQGARIVAVGTDLARLDELTVELGATAIAMDLRTPDSAEQIITRALQAHGQVDAVIANAGIGLAGDLTDHSPAQLAEVITVNLTSTINLARASLPPMRAQGRGALVFVTSIAGALGVPGESAYSASKAGVETFADALRDELRDDRITVSTLLPGVVDTDFFRTRGADYDRRFPRPIPPERAAEAIVALLRNGRRRAFVPRWLAVPARLQGAAPGTYRALARKFG